MITENLTLSTVTQEAYTETVTNDNCPSTVATVNIISEVAPTIITNSTTDTICDGTSVTLTADGVPGSNAHYVWEADNGNGWEVMEETGNSVSLIPITTTTFRVWITSTYCGETDTVSKTVYVNKNPRITISADDAARILCHWC